MIYLFIFFIKVIYFIIAMMVGLHLLYYYYLTIKIIIVFIHYIVYNCRLQYMHYMYLADINEQNIYIMRRGDNIF